MRTVLQTVVAVCIVWTSGVAGASAADVVVSLHKDVSITGASVAVADIAALSGTPEAADAVGFVKVGYAPLVGEGIVIPAAIVARAVQEQLSPKGINIKVTGSERVRVKRVGRSLPGSDIVHVAEAFLRHETTKVADKVSVHHVGVVRPMAVPVGDVELRPSLRDPAIRQRMSVWIDVVVDGEHYQTTSLWFDVSAIDSVAIAARKMGARQELSKESVALGDVDIARVRGTPIFELSGLEGYRVKSAVSSGAPLVFENVERAPPVENGQKVTVEGSFGSIRLVSSAVARSDGKLGEVIDVVSPANETYQATVMGRGVVSVDE